MLYLYKGYNPLSTCKNIWLQSLVLCQCPYVVFPSCSFWVEEEVYEGIYFGHVMF
jgi:hypothetical protein